MSDVLRIGILGTADIAQRMLIPAIRSLPQRFSLVGIATRKLDIDDRKKIVATELVEGYESLLDTGLDAIYIPLPNALHYRWIKKSLEQNIHVLVEKSMACSYQEVLELNNLAKSKNLILIENFQFQFHSQWLFIKNFVNEGGIGTVRSVQSSFGFPPFKQKNNIRYSRALGGGALLDAGAYPIKIAQLLLGAELAVKGSNITHSTELEVDIAGSAFLVCEQTDISVFLSWGFDNFYQNKIIVWGSEGILTASRIFTAGPGIKARVKIETNDGTDTKIFEDNHFINMLNNFHSLIDSGSNSNLDYDANINQAKLLEEIRGR